MTTEVFQRGESVPIWAENRKWDGTLTDPTQGVKITLKDPDGVLAKDATGADIDDKVMGKETTPRDGIYVFYYDSKEVTTLAANITATATSITVATGEGIKLPASNFYIEIDDEILKCTSRTDDVLTVTRGQKDTTASAHNSGTSVWRIRGWWRYEITAQDGTGEDARYTVTEGGFELK